MTLRMIVRAPDLPDAVTVEVPRGTAVLIGRAPDPAKLLPQRGASVSGRLQTVPLASAQVSGNHLLAEHRAEGLFISDLNSRNGSWLRLVPGREVRLPEIDLTLDLARPSTFTASDEGPEEARWSDPRDFAAGVLAAVDRWLQRRDIRAQVVLRAEAEGAAQDLPAFGLADGLTLVVRLQAEATFASSWLDRVRAYSGVAVVRAGMRANPTRRAAC